MSGLFPLPAVDRYSPPPPGFNQLLQDSRVAHCVIFTEEEEGWRSNRVVVENLDAFIVKICSVGFEEPEVEHGNISDKTL